MRICWLRFWILSFFIVIYASGLRFCKQNTFDWAIIGGDMIVPLGLRLSGIQFHLVSDQAEFYSA
jgi:hypothetical protein